MKRLSRLRVGTTLLLLILGGGLSSLDAADAPSEVRELRMQTVGDVTYFHLRLEPPREMRDEDNHPESVWWSGPSPVLSPRLVADGKLRLVCQRFDRRSEL